jgi:hypothetical protein
MTSITTSLSLRSNLRVSGAIAPYTVLGISPQFVADFVEEEYVRNAGGSTFANAITHTRASTATMVDSDGVLKWGPHNLALRSEEFDNSPWQKTNSTITSNTAAAPDGTNTADQLSHSSSVSDFVQFASGGISGAVFTNLIYVKYVDHQWFRLHSEVGSVWFDILNGTIGTSQAGVTGSIQSVGSGWYLVSVTRENTGLGLRHGIVLATSNGAFDEAVGTSAYIWGAHLYRSDLGGMVDNPERGDSYVPTTASAVYMPRVGHHVWNG